MIANYYALLIRISTSTRTKQEIMLVAKLVSNNLSDALNHLARITLQQKSKLGAGVTSLSSLIHSSPRAFHGCTCKYILHLLQKKLILKLDFIRSESEGRFRSNNTATSIKYIAINYYWS